MAGTTAGTTGEMTGETTTSPGRATPVRDLAEMIGHYLSVRVTYVHADGPDEHVEMVGMVTAVSPLVSVDQAGSATPFTLPPDPESYRLVPRSPFAPEGWGESELSPRYETTWRVRAPQGSAVNPQSHAFEPGRRRSATAPPATARPSRARPPKRQP
jgi:hypothetical protein